MEWRGDHLRETVSRLELTYVMMQTKPMEDLKPKDLKSMSWCGGGEDVGEADY